MGRPARTRTVVLDEASTPDRAWVEPAGWGGPKNRQHFDLRAPGELDAECDRLLRLRASVVARRDDLVVMADPEGNEFCLET